MTRLTFPPGQRACDFFRWADHHRLSVHFGRFGLYVKRRKPTTPPSAA